MKTEVASTKIEEKGKKATLKDVLEALDKIVEKLSSIERILLTQ